MMSLVNMSSSHIIKTGFQVDNYCLIIIITY